MANNSGPNKRLNGPDGRVRNTQTSNAARGGGIPGVPKNVPTPGVPGFGASYGEVPGATAGLASAYGAFQYTANAMRAQRVGLKAGLKPAVKGIRAGAVGQMSDVINQAIDRGVLGSSDISQQRVGVISGMKSDIEAAKQDVRNQILQSKVEEQQAYMQYTIQQQQMEMQAAAARQQAALQEQAIAAQSQSSQALLDYIQGIGSRGNYQLNIPKEGTRVLMKGVWVTIMPEDTKQDIQRKVLAGQAFKQGMQNKTAAMISQGL